MFTESILNFLLRCLTQKGLGGAASEALHSICAACSNHMMSHFQGLLQIAKAIDSFDINNDAAIGILKGKLIINLIIHLKRLIIK